MFILTRMNKFRLNKNNLIIGAVILGLVIVIGWAYIESTRPLPGEKTSDLGRTHVDVGTEVKYETNPPTSGPHYSDWKRAGIYEGVEEDRYLVHSLEHGYIIMSYNCSRQAKGLIPQVFAQDSTNSAQATDSASLNSDFSSDECKKLVEQLKSVYEKKGKNRLIIVPRPSLDSRITLTAWTRIEKMDNFDQNKIERFIDAFRNRGPEQTME